MVSSRDNRVQPKGDEEFACRVCKRVYRGPQNRFCPADDSPLFRVESLARLGSRLNQYNLLDILGEGGMGVVYKARHVMLDRLVAVKILHKHLAQRRGVVEQFVKEARAASKIPSAHIVDVTDFGWSPGGAVYLVMEYLDGISLDDVLVARGTIPLFDAVNIINQMVSALAYTHDEGIVHCDLKPENVILIHQQGNRRVLRKTQAAQFEVEQEAGYEFVKLLDFGVATFLRGSAADQSGEQAGTVFGTPQYMSPEQARGKHVDHRSDIYALGIMLYEMITGDVPFDDELDPQKVLYDQVHTKVPSLQQVNPDVEVDEATTRTILRCLEKKPARRFQSMDELLVALQHCFTDRVFLRDAARMPGAIEAGIEVPQQGWEESTYRARLHHFSDEDTGKFLRSALDQAPPPPEHVTEDTAEYPPRSRTLPGIGDPPKRR